MRTAITLLFLGLLVLGVYSGIQTVEELQQKWEIRINAHLP